MHLAPFVKSTPARASHTFDSDSADQASNFLFFMFFWFGAGYWFPSRSGVIEEGGSIAEFSGWKNGFAGN